MSTNEYTFRNVSQRVIARLSFAGWLRILAASALYVYGAAIVLSAALWFVGIHRLDIVSAVVLALVHLTVTAIWAWLRRPSAETAFAIWDERAGRDEGFVSAYCFEVQDERTVGEQLHLDRAASQLTDEVSKLKRDLPFPLMHRIWISPLVFIAIAVLIPAKPLLPGNLVVDKSDRERAREVAQKLDTRPRLRDEQKGLDPKEKEELQKLEQSLDKTVDGLRDLSKETRRDVLAELERKAHEAESLADALNGNAKELLSSGMLAELERHVDTTSLASALKADDLKTAAEESKELAERLKNKDLSLEERKRIENAFNKAMSAASSSDKQSMVGKRLGQSLEQLQKKQPEKAANEFSELSKELLQRLQRQSARNQLQELAQQLRKAGQQIFQQSQSDIKRLAQNPPAGMRELSAQQSKTLRDLNLQMQPGGSQQAQMGQSMGQMAMPTNMGSSQQPMPGSQGSGNPGQGQMMGQFPIPGTEQGQMAGQNAGQMPGSGSGQGGAIPVPGTTAAMGAGVGGLEAGHGTAPMGTSMTIPRDATQTGMVNAQISGEGPSAVRNTTGQMQREETARETRRLAEKFIKTEEAALADEPIPLSRREQVLRYFTALRKQLVESK
jgi:hypothetical protein